MKICHPLAREFKRLEITDDMKVPSWRCPKCGTVAYMSGCDLGGNGTGSITMDYYEPAEPSAIGIIQPVKTK